MYPCQKNQTVSYSSRLGQIPGGFLDSDVHLTNLLNTVIFPFWHPRLLFGYFRTKASARAVRAAVTSLVAY